MKPAEIDKEKGDTYNFVIDKSSIGTRIDKFLANHLGSKSRSQIQDFFKKGRIKVNAKLISKNYKLKIADSISVDFIDTDIAWLNPINETDAISYKTNNQIDTNNDEFEIMKIRLESIQKDLKETSRRLFENERKLSIERSKSALLGEKNAELNSEKTTLEEKLGKLNDRLQVKEKELNKLQSEDHKKENSILVEKTLKIGKFDAWNREKFETLQANTKQQFVEYLKVLAHYKDELDKFQGKLSETKNEPEKSEDPYAIPVGEKVSSAEEYSLWWHEKLDGLEEETYELYMRFESTVARQKRRLDKLSVKENIDHLTNQKQSTPLIPTSINISIKDEIASALNVYWWKFLRKNVDSKISYREYQYPKDKENNHQRNLIRMSVIVFGSLISFLVSLKLLF